MRPVQADAFWLRAPGCGEIRPVTLPEPGRGRGDGAHPALRRQPRHRDVGVPGRRAARPVRRHAGAISGGGLPGPGQVRLPQRRRGGARDRPELRGRTVFCLYPHQTAYVVPAARGDRRARGRATRSCRSRGHGRDRRQRPVGRRAAARRPGHRRRRRHGRLLRRTPAEPVPGGAGHARGRRCRPGRRRGRTRRRLRAAGRRRRRSRPRRARQRDVRRAAALARPARARGHGHRPQLVRRHRGPALAGRRVPLGSPRHPRQPGRHRLPGPQRAPHDGRPAGARTRAAARPRLRRAHHRAVPLRRAARRDGPAGRGEPAGALPHHHLRREE